MIFPWRIKNSLSITTIIRYSYLSSRSEPFIPIARISDLFPLKLPIIDNYLKSETQKERSNQ